MNYSIWKHNDGTWQNGISPNSSNVSMDAEYTFTVPNRKIIGVTMERYNSSDSIHIATWKDTRTERSSDLESNACYVKSVSPNPSWSGKNTSTAKVNCDLTLDLTKNYIQTGVPSPKNERKEWQGENVEGFTYDVPVIFRIELEPLKDPLDTIEVTYVDESGNTIRPKDIITPSTEGYYRVYVKSIEGYIYKQWKYLNTGAVKTDTNIQVYINRTGMVHRIEIQYQKKDPLEKAKLTVDLTANPTIVQKGKSSRLDCITDSSSPIIRRTYYLNREHESSKENKETFTVTVESEQTWMVEVENQEGLKAQDEVTIKVIEECPPPLF
ncbi:MAG: MucBP domain-containing protein [Clostridiales bacterium]|nr:MucBP domain-containing protein [Clostridiales bacterium]